MFIIYYIDRWVVSVTLCTKAGVDWHNVLGFILAMAMCCKRSFKSVTSLHKGEAQYLTEIIN